MVIYFLYYANVESRARMKMTIEIEYIGLLGKIKIEAKRRKIKI